MRQSFRIAWNAFTNYAREVVLILLALLVNPLLFHGLGKEAYGVLALSIVTQGFLYLLDVGMAHAVARFVSKYHALQDTHQVGRVVSTALAVYVLLGLLACAVVTTIGLFFLPHLGVPTSVLPQARWLIVLVGVGLLVRFLCYAFEGVLRGLEHFDISNVAYLAERIVFAGAAVLAVCVWHRGLVVVGFCTLAGVIVSNVIRIVGVLRLSHVPAPRWQLVSRATLKEIFSYGVLASLTQLSSFAQGGVSLLLLSAYLGTTALGFYNLIMTVVSLETRLWTGVGIVLMPVASKFEALAETERLRQLLYGGSRLVLTMVVPSVVWMMVMARPLMRTWVGPELADFAPVLLCMALVYFVDLITGVGEMVLMGMGRVAYLGWTYLLTSLGSLVILWPLLAGTNLGMYALAVSLGIAFLIRRVLILIHMCQSVGRSSWSYIRSVLLPVLASGMVTAVALLILRQGLPAAGWPGVLLSIAVGGIVHLAVSWVIVLSQDERRQLLSLAARIRQRLLPAARRPEEL